MNRLPPEYDLPLPTGMKDGDRIINTIKVENHLKVMSAALKTKTKKKRKVKNED